MALVGKQYRSSYLADTITLLCERVERLGKGDLYATAESRHAGSYLVLVGGDEHKQRNKLMIQIQTCTGEYDTRPIVMTC